MSDSLYAVQEAIKTTLAADATLTALVSTRIYDHVPAESTFPYITIGHVTALPFDVKDETGMEQTITIHVWSRYRGLKEVKQITAAIDGALNRATLSVTGHDFIDCTFEFADTFDDPDGLTRHAVQRFRITTQET